MCTLSYMRETFCAKNLEFYKDRAFEVVGFGSEHGIFDTKDILFWHEEINRVFDDRLVSLPVSRSLESLEEAINRAIENGNVTL